MKDPLFFGYGSLVNGATHAYPDLRAATLIGWRRVWRHTELSETAFLTAIPQDGSEIEGMIARVPDGDWRALDLREAAYCRVDVQIEDTPVAVYSIAEGRHPAPRAPRHVLLSYLDVVVQGYFQGFGMAGVQRFFDTTAGWDAPILNDRETPLYSRSQRLSPVETALVDRHLERLEARIIPF